MARKILIIEDNHSIRELTEEQFKIMGFTVFTAPDGREGMKILLGLASRGVYLDVILCDYNMPHFNGLEVFEVASDTQKDRFVLWTGARPKDLPSDLKHFASKDLDKEEMQNLVEHIIADGRQRWHDESQLASTIYISNAPIRIYAESTSAGLFWKMSSERFGTDKLGSAGMRNAKLSALEKMSVILAKEIKDREATWGQVRGAMDLMEENRKNGK